MRRHIAFVSDRSGRDEIWLSDPDGRGLKAITNLDNEKGAIEWSPDSRALFYTAADKRLYSDAVADGKTAVIASDTVARIGALAISPDSKWVAFTKQEASRSRCSRSSKPSAGSGRAIGCPESSATICEIWSRCARSA